MSEIVEIILLIACCGVLGAVAICFISETVLTHRYKKFYETTEDGKKLYYARYTLDLLKLKKCSFIKNQMELKDRIDEYITYMPDEGESREILRELKLQYGCNNEEFKRIKQKIEDWGKRIDEMVAALPKKYKGILEYGWRNAKVEVEEEEDICW